MSKRTCKNQNTNTGVLKIIIKAIRLCGGQTQPYHRKVPLCLVNMDKRREEKQQFCECWTWSKSVLGPYFA